MILLLYIELLCVCVCVCVCVCCRGFGLRLAFVALPMQTKLYDKDVKALYSINIKS